MLGGDGESECVEDCCDSTFGNILLFDVRLYAGNVRDFRVDGEIRVFEGHQELFSLGLHT